MSRVSPELFSRQVGVDILPDQVAYASSKYGTRYRQFRHITNAAEMQSWDEQFDCVTLIEVIEHLTQAEIVDLFDVVGKNLLKPGGKFVFSTPNYTSAWPVIEVLLNTLSKVSYKDQHITKFNYFTMVKRLRKIYPDFDRHFTVDFKTTTHFITPFLANFGIEFAQSVSRLVPHNQWKFPFGNLVVMRLTKK